MLMMWIVLLPALALPAAADTVADADDSAAQYEQSVVGLDVTYQEWDEDRPWAKMIPKHRTAAAVLLDGAHLLTTAQMVDQATLIRLVTFGRTRPVEPRVVRVDPDINLALLVIEDQEVLKSLKPVPLAESTPTAGVLRSVRWSGQQLESAASRVIGIMVERSWGGRLDHAFLHMRTDMDSGGWGEPVFADGSLVGLTVSQKEQRSRAIPVELLRAFFDRVREPEPMAGFPSLGLDWQVNEDRALAGFLGQQGEPRGVLIREVPWGASACGVLEPRDILLELAGNPIDSEGYYNHPRLGRLIFSHLLVERYRPGDTVEALVLRGGRELTVSIPLRTYPASLDLIPARREGPPPYVVAGGLVIRELDLPYLGTWGADWAEQASVGLTTRYSLNRNGQTRERRRFVLITATLPAEYNVGYQDLRDAVIEEVNGRPVSSIRDVVQGLAAPLGDYQLIRLAPDSGRDVVVLDAATFDQATKEILETYRVPAAVRLPAEPLPEGGGDCPGAS
jgi:S1-C subfamily serine protease